MQGKNIETIESLTATGEMHPLQKSFVENGAIQCGFCTPGMILTSKALLDKKPKADEEDIKRYVGGNFCRCTGYNQIIDAIKKVAEGSVS
jgi:carbon-monoxide dehydrogenase small subunit